VGGGVNISWLHTTVIHILVLVPCGVNFFDSDSDSEKKTCFGLRSYNLSESDSGSEKLRKFFCRSLATSKLFWFIRLWLDQKVSRSTRTNGCCAIHLDLEFILCSLKLVYKNRKSIYFCSLFKIWRIKVLSYEGKNQIFDTNMAPTLTPEKILLDDSDSDFGRIYFCDSAGVGVGVGFQSPVQGTTGECCWILTSPVRS